tara:strand:- start:572 stop:1192 length:621 start_codon:yes stop_codon:yes gene_type:complete
MRHFAWFHLDDGHWLGEWRGTVPSPPVRLLSKVGDARILGMNAWLQETQRMITPFASPYVVIDEMWDEAAWDTCEKGSAVCLDVTHLGWPVGDHYWHRWDAIDQALESPVQRLHLQVDRATRRLDVNQTSSRPIRSTAAKAMLDITDTPLAPFHGNLLGPVVRQDGRWVLPSAPAEMSAAITDALEATECVVDMALAAAPEKELTS